MEERLLQIIKTGKGEIKDLLQAEKELGVWRTKFEEFEGELRYYRNLVALSTLTMTLYEKEIRSPFAIIETERVQMGIEVEDVDKSAASAGRGGRGERTRNQVRVETASSRSVSARSSNSRSHPAEPGLSVIACGNWGPWPAWKSTGFSKAKEAAAMPRVRASKRNDTQFIVSLYNVANVAPRETVQITLAGADTEAMYKTILARAQKSVGRVVSSTLNRQRAGEATGAILFEVKAGDAEAVLRDLKEVGEVLRLQITENPDTQNVTRSKRGFDVQLLPLSQVAPRDTRVIHLASGDVAAGYHLLREAIAKAKGRILNAQLNEQDKQNISAQLDFDIRKSEASPLDARALANSGVIISQNVTPRPRRR